MNVAQRRPAEFYRGGNVAQVALYQNHVGGVYRHVGAGAYGYADIRPCQRGSVVYAVAHHSHFAEFLQTPYDVFFIARQHVGNNFVYARLSAYRRRGAGVVSREHHDVHTHFFKFLNRLRAVRPDGVRDGDYAQKTAVI